MFSFNRQNKLVEVQKYIRRLADLTSPNLCSVEGELRATSRQNRVLPTILIPVEKNEPVVGEATPALTKDVSDDGVGLVLHQPLHVEQVAIGLWLAEEETPWFFQGEVRQNSRIGGGYWVIGVKLTEVLNVTESLHSILLPLAEQLLPGEAPRRPSELLNA